MGRVAEGWKLKKPDPRTGIRNVRFRHDGKRHDLSTGHRDLAKARKEAARIYAETITGSRGQPAKRGGLTLSELLADWIADLTGVLAANTVQGYEYTAFASVEPYFKTLKAITTSSMEDYLQHRLTEALRDSIKKDQRVLRRFLRWCVKRGDLAVAPKVPAIPGTMPGTRTGHKKTRAVPLTIDEANAFLASLPERSTLKKFPIRARFVVQWETSLRPSTVARIKVPDHYRKGASTLIITDAIDKARFGRELPLTDAARAALDSACPESGYVFGPRQPGVFKSYIKAAAAVARLAPEKVAALTAYDLRHGRITTLLDAGTPLRAAAFMAGHKRITTTNKYVDVAAAHREALAALVRTGGIAGVTAGGDTTMSRKNSQIREAPPSSSWVEASSKRRKKAAVSGGPERRSDAFETLSGVSSGGVAQSAVGLAYLMAGDVDAYVYALAGEEAFH